MPKLMPSNTMQTITIPGPGSFHFSAVRLDALEATEYTLVTIITDITSSVSPFANALLKCVQNIVTSCQKSPRAENLMIRLLAFNTDIFEIHGFKPLSEIDVNAYQPFQPCGMTALYDATYSGVSATLTFADHLMQQDFDANGCVYIITDGMDNASSMTPKTIAKQMQEAVFGEKIESLVSILIGLVDPRLSYAKDVRKALSSFQTKAGLSQFIDAGNATVAKLAKLAQFVSQSISNQSQALGSGQSPQALSF